MPWTNREDSSVRRSAAPVLAAVSFAELAPILAGATPIWSNKRFGGNKYAWSKKKRT